MTSIRKALRSLFPEVKTIPPGTYHYQAPSDAPLPYRLHLRIEPDGSGVLIVNAATVLHLNPTAAEFMYHLVQQTPEEEAARHVARRYRVGHLQALKDFRDLVQRIHSLIESPDLDPVAYLDFERFSPYSQTLSAPYRLDCALTYSLSPGSPAELAPANRVKHELSTEDWKRILDKAWDVGIPHVIFTGGEPTLREDLPELISYTEAKGQVSGLMTDGLKLADKAYLDNLLQTGLDHTMLVLNPDAPQAWQALQNTLDADLFMAVHLTLTPQNAAGFSDLLHRLSELKVEALSLSASDESLNADLTKARDLAAVLGLSLVWDLPVPYSSAHPVAVELAGNNGHTPEGAGRAWLYVEPDGDVLPAQGVNTILGNMLTDPWTQIWKA